MGRNVVVTGGASGVGKATAKAFLSLGDTVFLTDWKKENLDKAEAELKSLGTVYSLAGDVGKWDDVAKLADLVKGKGGCDVLANCAGVFRVGQIHDAPEDDYDYQFNVNVRGIFHTIKAFGPQMLAKKKGAIVNVSSVSGIGGDYNMSLYCATKGAVIALSNAVAMDYSMQGVRVNTVSPSAVKTPMFMTGLTDQVAELFRKNMPDRKLCEPEWCANAIVYLASDQAEHITAVNLPIDGGLSGWNGQPNQEK
ncbi:3-oxoacyl-ACP reductase [Spirochaetia bacterium]|nr:3-oxoacyl-ACP reductase [Spirochaetia bacterium]